MRSKSIPSILFLALTLGLTAPVADAHNIPNDVTIQAFLKPDGNRLHLLIRVPLEAMRDMNFPEFGTGFLDFDRSAPLLPDAAIVWVGDFIEMYEGASKLPKPTVVATRISLPAEVENPAAQGPAASIDLRLAIMPALHGLRRSESS